MGTEVHANGLPFSFVLDTSALLAMMQDAPGGSLVGVKLHHSAISALNLSEVLDFCFAHGFKIETMVDDLRALGLEIHPFSAEDASIVAQLTAKNSRAELSLSARACLALARRLGIPALTADNSWKNLDLGIEIRLLR